MKVLLLILLLFVGFSSVGWGQQNACVSGQSFKIVVLGSSTSAGTGASHPDSAWVNRYENYLMGINPANEVVNFGVGGYNTYRIMPTGFVPPAGRPNPDAARNITAAIAENPNAIIINMPSNDVSAGFSYAEQMFNLDTIVSIANQANIPIWVCTTQPRNFANQAQLDLQWEIKDSIYAYFNPYTIDFWTTIATPGYTIEPVYDSGDGVHLNDSGHGLLANRVIETNILDSIVIAPDTVDFAILDIIHDASVCGDSSTSVQVVVANVGLENTNPTDIDLETVNTTLGSSELSSYQYVTGMPSCTSDTLSFFVNTYQPGSYQISAAVTNSMDSVSINNENQEMLSTLGHPEPYLLNDTLCDPGMGQLFVMTAIDDHVNWYDDTTMSPISNNELLTIPFVDTTSLYYVQIVRGNLFYSSDLHSTLNSNINFNGTMFDLIASDSIVLDSFDVKIFSTGMQGVEVFYKSGTHLGYETDASAWTFLDDAMVNVTSSNQWTTVPIGGLSIAAGDTVGIHVRMENSGANLSYSNVSSPETRSTPELTMITGSGVSANFGNNYYPRDWSGGVYYHHGYRPLGDCATDTIEAMIVLSESELVAGNDTILDITDTLVAQASAGFETYDWSNGSDSSSTVLPAVDFGFGVHYIDLYATDTLGCVRYDEFVVAVADLVGLSEIEYNISIAPNPTKGNITIQAPKGAQIYFTDLNGKRVHVSQKNWLGEYALEALPSGTYLVHIIINQEHFVEKVIKMEW